MLRVRLRAAIARGPPPGGGLVGQRLRPPPVAVRVVRAFDEACVTVNDPLLNVPLCVAPAESFARSSATDPCVASNVEPSGIWGTPDFDRSTNDEVPASRTRTVPVAACAFAVLPMTG